MLQKVVISAIGHPKGPWSIDSLVCKGRERERCAPYLRVPKVSKQGVSQRTRGR